MTQGSPNALYLSQACQNLARNAEAAQAKAFQRVALVSMCIMAGASLVGVIQPLLRELSRKHDPGRSR